ncbi:unnamed protein product, partial [Polarella glacialis]
ANKVKEVTEEDTSQLKLPQIKEMLRSRGLPMNGKKAELLERLAAAPSVTPARQAELLEQLAAGKSSTSSDLLDKAPLRTKTASSNARLATEFLEKELQLPPDEAVSVAKDCKELQEASLDTLLTTLAFLEE